MRCRGCKLRQVCDIVFCREFPSEGEGLGIVHRCLRQPYKVVPLFVLARHRFVHVVAITHNGQEVLRPEEGFSRYSSLVQTLSFQMGEHVRLISSTGDTLRPANYYLDRTYGAGPATRLLFAFPAAAFPANNYRFCLQECGLDTGNLLFAFDARAFRAVPSLAIP